MEYQSNTDTVIDSLIGRLNVIKNMGNAAREIAAAMLASNLHRIHNTGKAVNGSDIGKYSTNPILVGAKSFTTKAAAAKVLGSKKKRKGGQWVTINGRHLLELEGKPVSHVNLNRTGTLQDDLGFEADGKDWVIGFRSQYGKDLREYMEEKYGKKIWGATKHDHDVAEQIIEKFIKKELSAKN